MQNPGSINRRSHFDIFCETVTASSSIFFVFSPPVPRRSGVCQGLHYLIDRGVVHGTRCVVKGLHPLPDVLEGDVIWRLPIPQRINVVVVLEHLKKTGANLCSLDV